MVRKQQFWGLLILFFSLSFGAQAQSVLLRGEVVDERTGEVLPGANIRVDETSQGTTTDVNGTFMFRNLKEGDYVLIVSFVGYKTKEVEVAVDDDEEANLEIPLVDNFIEMDGIIVQGVRQGQARALSEQKESMSIKNVIDAELISTFPDPNVGESLKRIPGINIQSDQGEARYVQIRGTSPNLSNISINGEKIAAPEGDGRSIALDMVPSDVLASIEVTKAITPDMDGDAIGGTVNLETKSALTSSRVLNATVNGGYHNNVSDLSPVGGRVSLNYGQRLGDDSKFGYMIGGNYNKFALGSDNNEIEYDEAELNAMELRDYELTRERIGATGNFDYRFNPDSRLYLNTSYNYFADQEYRRLIGLATDEAVREFKDRLEKQQIFSTSLSGEHNLNNGFYLDYGVSYSYSDQNTPSDQEIIYAQAYEDQAGEDVEFLSFDRSDPDYPQFSLTAGAPSGAGVYEYGQYEFDEFVSASELTTDQHFTTRADLSKAFTLSDELSGTLKFGGLGRFKSKDRDLTENVYDGYNGSASYQDLTGGFIDDDYLSGHYAPSAVGLFPTSDNMNSLFDNNRSDFEVASDDTKEASNAEDYEATEDTYASYVMTDLQWGNLAAIVGMRYEHLATEYDGNVVEYDQNEELQPIQKVGDKNTFDFFLPMVHLKYDIQDKANLRLAWTNTYSKPNYFNLVPYRIISRPDEEIELGNPELEPARSMNLDLMGEYYFSSIGIISAGVFYKNISDFIYTANFDFDEAPYVGYKAEQPINGDDADLLGFELALQRQLTFLPGFASGFGVYANYTYTWSEARLTTEDGNARTVSLPGQAADVANFAISYEKYGFSGRVSLNYSGEFIEEIRSTSSSDRYYDKRTQIDVSVSQQVTSNIRVFADLVNLTNEPLRFYNGVSRRPEQQEFYSFQAKLGFKLSL